MAGGARDRRGVAPKLFSIVDAIARVGDASLTQIARETGLPLATAHRLLGEWEAWGGVHRTEDGRYAIGMQLWRLGVRQPTARKLRRAALPYLEDLLVSSEEHVHLAVRDGLGVVYLERLSGRAAVSAISDVGSRLPLHATGVGLVLLAAAPVGLLEEVLAAGPRKFLPATPTTDHELRERLAEVRATGMARSVETLTAGAFSLAAPVRDSTGEVVAAVSIVAHVERRGEAHLEADVRMAARGISAALGHRP